MVRYAVYHKDFEEFVITFAHLETRMKDYGFYDTGLMFSAENEEELNFCKRRVDALLAELKSGNLTLEEKLFPPIKYGFVEASEVADAAS